MQGLSPRSVCALSLISSLLSHSNLKTPKWLLIARIKSIQLKGIYEARTFSPVAPSTVIYALFLSFSCTQFFFLLFLLIPLKFLFIPLFSFQAFALVFTHSSVAVFCLPSVFLADSYISISLVSVSLLIIHVYIYFPQFPNSKAHIFTVVACLFIFLVQMFLFSFLQHLHIV